MWWHRAFVVSGLVVVFVLAGCPDKNSPARKMEQDLVRMAEISARTCACKTLECANASEREFQMWAHERAEQHTDADREYRDTHRAADERLNELVRMHGLCGAALGVAPPTGGS